MDAKERVTIDFLESLHNLSNIETFCVDELIKQARIDALEEAAKVADECEGHYSPECECMNIAKSIRDLKEK